MAKGRGVKGWVVVAGAVVGVVAVRRVRSRRTGTKARKPDRWLAVTVNRPPAEVAADGALPRPLAELGAGVELEVRPAPGGRGTEIAARPSRRGRVARLTRRGKAYERVRAALRESKQLLEVGELLRVDPQPAGRRRRTPGGKALEAATRRAAREGLL